MPSARACAVVIFAPALPRAVVQAATREVRPHPFLKKAATSKKQSPSPASSPGRARRAPPSPATTSPSGRRKVPEVRSIDTVRVLHHLRTCGDASRLSCPTLRRLAPRLLPRKRSQVSVAATGAGSKLVSPTPRRMKTAEHGRTTLNTLPKRPHPFFVRCWLTPAHDLRGAVALTVADGCFWFAAHHRP